MSSEPASAATVRVADTQRRGVQPRRGVALALAATGLWSTTGVFIDPLVSHYHATPVQISCWRALRPPQWLGMALILAGVLLIQGGALRGRA